MPSSAAQENQSTLPCPCGRTMKAASSGPIAEPRLPPTWNTDCARPCRPPEAMRATREDSGWKTDEPVPIIAAASRSSDVGVGGGEQGEAGQGEAHARGERIRSRLAVRVAADQRLQQRGRDLVGEGEQADLAEAERVRGLQHRIQRRQQRLHHVVEQMAEADRGEHREGGAAGGICPAHPGCGFVHGFSWLMGMQAPAAPLPGTATRHSAGLSPAIPSLLRRRTLAAGHIRFRAGRAHRRSAPAGPAPPRPGGRRRRR